MGKFSLSPKLFQSANKIANLKITAQTSAQDMLWASEAFELDSLQWEILAKLKKTVVKNIKHEESQTLGRRCERTIKYEGVCKHFELLLKYFFAA